MGYIDEEKTQLNISDHCLVRAWFKVGTNNKRTNWKKAKTKEIQWIGKNEKSLKKFETAFIPLIGKSTTFRGCMGKIKTTLNSTMRKKKRVKVRGKGKKTILAAEWVDADILSNIILRSNYSRQWKLARKNKESEEVIEGCKRRYLEQQKKISIMSSSKKGLWEENKIKETWNDRKKVWTMIKELLGK